MPSAQCDPHEPDSTRWSIVLAAGNRASSKSEQALETLCRTYWYPLYAYVRRRITNADEAQDLTQEFFAQLLEKNYLADARPERGKFRSFLLAVFKHFLTKEWDKSRAQKRGGGLNKLSLDLEIGESRYQLEPLDEMTPERLYDRQWAVTLTNDALARLRDEYAAADKLDQFDVLKTFLAGSSQESSYREAAKLLKTSDGALRVAVHRLRQRYGELLRSTIAETVTRPEEVEEEIRALFVVFGH